jgi:outer membrane lipoprotein-sorting protein
MMVDFRFRVCLLGCALIAMAVGLPAQSLAGAAGLLQKVDAQVSYPDKDFSAEYTIVQESGGAVTSTQVAALFRRDKDNKYLILMLKPDSDKGKGYLKIDNNLWFYDPRDRRFVVTSAKDRFQNSNARNSDFTRSSLALDYKVVALAEEKLGRFECRVLRLEAVNDSVTFPKMKIWIDAENLVRKYEDYSLSDQLMRTTAIPAYQKIGQRFIPQGMVILDALRGKKVNGAFLGDTTRITIAKPSLDPVPDKLFSQAYLELVSR